MIEKVDSASLVKLLPVCTIHIVKNKLNVEFIPFKKRIIILLSEGHKSSTTIPYDVKTLLSLTKDIYISPIVVKTKLTRTFAKTRARGKVKVSLTMSIASHKI